MNKEKQEQLKSIVEYIEAFNRDALRKTLLPSTTLEQKPMRPRTKKNKVTRKTRYHRLKKEQDKAIDRELLTRFKQIVKEELGTGRKKPNAKGLSTGINELGLKRKDLFASFASFISSYKGTSEKDFWDALISWADTVTSNSVKVKSNLPF